MVIGVGPESTALGTGFEGDCIHSFGNGLSCCMVSWLLHGNKGADVVFEASEVIVHAGGLVHVREFKHDGLEFMVVGIDRCLL